MSAQPQETSSMTVAEFLAFEEAHPDGRYEYIDSYLRDLGALLMAGGTNNHATIAGNLIAALHNALRAQGRRCRTYSADVSFQPTPTTYLHPDVSVSCDARDLARNDGITFPSLVVEVLSPSTETYDRSRKLQLYSACQAIQDYLLVDTTQQLVEVYHRLPNGNMEYHAYSAGEVISLPALGCDIPLEDIYYGIAVA